jgi:hypothetical protein
MTGASHAQLGAGCLGSKPRSQRNQLYSLRLPEPFPRVHYAYSLFSSIPLKFLKICLFHVHECFVYMHVCIPHTCLVPMEARRVATEPGLTDSYGLACGCQELNLSALVRLACPLNHWSMSPAPPWKCIQQDNFSSWLWMTLHIRHLGTLSLF